MRAGGGGGDAIGSGPADTPAWEAELPSQVRSQVELGNEGARRYARGGGASTRYVWSNVRLEARGLRDCGSQDGGATKTAYSARAKMAFMARAVFWIRVSGEYL